MDFSFALISILLTFENTGNVGVDPCFHKIGLNVGFILSLILPLPFPTFLQMNVIAYSSDELSLDDSSSIFGTKSVN